MMFVSIGIGTALAVALIVIVSLLTGGSVKGNSAPPALVGTHLTSLSENGLTGGTLAAPWNAHHASVVIFFASWCAPCKQELPALASYLADHNLGKVSVLGVDVEDSRSAARATVNKYHLKLPVLFDPSSTVAAGRFKLLGLPDTVFVDAQGIVRAETIGAISTTKFAAGVAQLNA